MLAGGARRWELRAGLMDGSMAAPGRGVAFTPGGNGRDRTGFCIADHAVVSAPWLSLPRHTSSCNSAPGGPHSHKCRSFPAASPGIGHFMMIFPVA